MSEPVDYEVGYRRPPKDKQFRKGQSGNPSGRRRTTLTKSEMIARVRDRPMKVRIDGREVRLSFFEACVWRVHQTVMTSGRIADIERLFRLYEKHGVAPEQEKLAEAREAGEKVVQKLMEYFDRTVDDDPIPANVESDRS
jgi:hypothetical protein